MDFELRDGHGQAAVTPAPVERPSVGDPGNGLGLRGRSYRHSDVFERRDEVREAVAVGERHPGRVEEVDGELPVAGPPERDVQTVRAFDPNGRVGVERGG